jgi:hypothetical protein
MAVLLDVPFLTVTAKGLQRHDESPVWSIPGAGPLFQPERARNLADREICVALAGAVAESVHNDWDWRLTPCGRKDRDFAIEITWDLEHDWEARCAWVSRVREITRDFFCLLDVWWAVQDVADQLRKKGTVTRNEVRGIVRKRLTVPKQIDERHSTNEYRWRRIEDVRSLGAVQPDGAHFAPTCEHVYANLSDHGKVSLVKVAAA